jgi:hypothetical protein
MLTILLIQLQAAMALGALLYIIGSLILFVVFPCAWLAATVLRIRKIRKSGTSLDGRTYALAILFGLGIGVLTILTIAIIIFLLLYFFVDLTYS